VSEPTVIDGSQGEGGGQILRTAVSLAALNGRAITIENIRANRKKPGLRPQHLTAVQAVAEISSARCSGVSLNSRRLSFAPQRVRGGSYRFVVPTAGSACLVLQTVLWPLLFAEQPSTVVFEGGTHNSLAPPFDFIDRSFLPLLRGMGGKVQARLERYGFYPAGGGRFCVDIIPVRSLTPLELLTAGPVRTRRAEALVARLPAHIAERELKVVRRELDWSASECVATVVSETAGPGNVLLLTIERPELTEVIAGFGQRGIRAEHVAHRAARAAASYLDSQAPVGTHLADQLIIPFALAGSGVFRSPPLSGHAQTNITVVERLLNVQVRTEPVGSDVLVRFAAS
jgi:RNA 3'-terminal phosphate cyclase (ATP)